MRPRLYAVMLVSCGVWGSSFSTLQAQAVCPETHPIRSNGIILAISGIKTRDREIFLQFTATNASQARIYLRNAEADQSQYASLSSGSQITYPQVMAIPTCYSIASCMEPASGSLELTKYSSVDPGDQMSFSFRYTARYPIAEDDTISFSAAFAARFSVENHDPEASAGKPRAIRFSFTQVYLGKCQ